MPNLKDFTDDAIKNYTFKVLKDTSPLDSFYTDALNYLLSNKQETFNFYLREYITNLDNYLNKLIPNDSDQRYKLKTLEVIKLGFNLNEPDKLLNIDKTQSNIPANISFGATLKLYCQTLDLSKTYSTYLVAFYNKYEDLMLSMLNSYDLSIFPHLEEDIVKSLTTSNNISGLKNNLFEKYLNKVDLKTLNIDEFAHVLQNALCSSGAIYRKDLTVEMSKIEHPLLNKWLSESPYWEPTRQYISNLEKLDLWPDTSYAFYDELQSQLHTIQSTNNIQNNLELPTL